MNTIQHDITRHVVKCNLRMLCALEKEETLILCLNKSNVKSIQDKFNLLGEKIKILREIHCNKLYLKT